MVFLGQQGSGPLDLLGVALLLLLQSVLEDTQIQAIVRAQPHSSLQPIQFLVLLHKRFSAALLDLLDLQQQVFVLVDEVKFFIVLVLL